MVSSAKKAFVAYPSQDRTLSDGIADSVHRANAVPTGVRFEPWVFNDVAGIDLISPILERIDESLFVVADVTYLNLNVVYEIGFTIGRGKRSFLIRHSGIDGHKALAAKAGIFDTLGYFEYQEFEHLRDRLASHIDPEALQVGETLNRQAPIYIVEPPLRDHSATLMTSRVKKSGYRYRSFNPAEDIRLSGTDAIRQVAASAGIVLMLRAESDDDAEAHNVRSMFVAGLAHGLDKPTLILSPANYVAPADVRDQVKRFQVPTDIVEAIAELCPGVNDYLQAAEPVQIETKGLLQSLSIGDPTAENEMTTLGVYYLRTDQYQRAVRGEVNLVVGRKGAGKTALFIQVRDKIRADKRNIVADLKPEGYQLLKLKEDILVLLSAGARQHLITAFWEYLLLLEVAYKLLEKDQHTYRFNHELRELYIELEGTYKVKGFSGEGDFSERLLTLSKRLSDEYLLRYGSNTDRRLTADEIAAVLYAHDIRLLRERVSTYLARKQSVWILFDNLDKGWSTQGIDEADAIVLRCLIDAGRKIEREMGKVGHQFHCIVFIRNDVYEHLMANSADYGKEMRAVLDWTDPDQLRELLRRRFIARMGEEAQTVTFPQLWAQLIASHVRGEESSSYVIARSLMRPRNLLKIFNHCRGFAVNLRRPRITEEDIDKGVRAYSQDLLIELDRELSDVFPDAKELIYYLTDSPPTLSVAELTKVVAEAGLSPLDTTKVIDFLVYYGVLGVKTEAGEYFIYDVNYDFKAIKIRIARGGESSMYLVNPAFWPALNIGGSGAFSEQADLDLAPRREGG